MDTNTIIILVAIILIIVFSVNAVKKEKKKKQKQLKDFVDKVEEKLNGFVKEGIKPIDADINLNKGENSYGLLKSVDWKEFRKVRTGNVAGHGIVGRVNITKGIRYRYGIGQIGSQSVDELKTIDTGDLYITNKRIIFRGSQGNKSLPFSKILAINPSTSGIQIEKEVGKNVFIPFDFMKNPDSLAIIQFCFAIKN